MKKTCVLTLGLFTALSMSAQLNVVKDAEKAFKGADNYGAYQKAIGAIKPAFTNPETDKQAQTYWIPGKAGFKIYDDMYAKKAIGQDVNLSDMGAALIDGYDYAMKALALDIRFFILGQPRICKSLQCLDYLSVNSPESSFRQVSSRCASRLNCSSV